MSRDQISICMLSFLIIFIITTFTFYSLGLPQVPKSLSSKPANWQTTKARQVAELLHGYIFQNDFDEFAELLDNHPRYINAVKFYPTYGTVLNSLQYAVILSRDEFIDNLLSRRGTDPKITTLSGDNTLLHLASSPRIAKKLIDLGLDLEARNSQAMTPLLLQVSKKRLNTEVIYTLLEAGANPNAKTTSSRLTALHILFTPHHANTNQEVLLTVLEDLLDHGARVDARAAYRRVTPLHFAAANNNVQAIQIFINKATQMGLKNFIHVKDSFGNTPLFMAYHHQSRKAITQLLTLGANPFLKNKSGVSVNGEVLLPNNRRKVLDFNKFVSDEIIRHSQPSDHCAQPLMPTSS